MDKSMKQAFYLNDFNSEINLLLLVFKMNSIKLSLSKNPLLIFITNFSFRDLTSGRNSQGISASNVLKSNM